MDVSTREMVSNTASSPNQWLRVLTLFVTTDLPDLQQLVSQTSHQLDPLVLAHPCLQSPWNPQDLQKPDPQDSLDPLAQDSLDPVVPLDPLVQQPLNHLTA